jgi:hypothetical protein
MKQILAAFILTLVAVAPASAQQAGGMSAMGYYVGTWTCVGGPVGLPPATATVTDVMNGGVMNGSVSIPVQAGMKVPYSASLVTSYDGKGRYIQTFLDDHGIWSVSYAPTWTGNTEQWTDLTTSDSKLGHGEAVRTDNDHYTYTGFGTPTGTTPNFKIACQRQSS